MSLRFEGSLHITLYEESRLVSLKFDVLIIRPGGMTEGDDTLQGRIFWRYEKLHHHLSVFRRCISIRLHSLFAFTI